MAVRYRILCVGRRADDPWLDAADVYLERLQRYAKAELVRVKDGTKASEAEALRAKLPKGAVRLVLDERGAAWSTDELARRAGQWSRADRDVACVVGGAEGLDASLRQGADAVVALSGFTLPHRLALALWLEQLYRAHTVVAGRGITAGDGSDHQDAKAAKKEILILAALAPWRFQALRPRDLLLPSSGADLLAW